jgi:hypothetical protein
MSSIRSLGVIWDPENAENFPVCLDQFIKQMNERKIETRIIGYFAGRMIPEKLAAVKCLTCICRNDLDAFYVPVSHKAADFMNEKIDVLIDLNFKQIFPLRFISLLSKAGFKVGLSGSNGESLHYDLMMDVRPPFEISEYLKHVLYYLEMINSGSVN